MDSLKHHAFFEDIDFSRLQTQESPLLELYRQFEEADNGLDYDMPDDLFAGEDFDHDFTNQVN